MWRSRQFTQISLVPLQRGVTLSVGISTSGVSRAQMRQVLTGTGAANGPLEGHNRVKYAGRASFVEERGGVVDHGPLTLGV
jgi:hypothetical protein